MATLRAVSARRLHGLFQHAREPIFVLDPSLRIAFANRAWEELTGRTSEAVSGLVCQPGRAQTEDVSLGELASSFCPPAEALQGRPCSGVSLVPNASGERLARRLEFTPLHDARGRLAALLGLVRDLGTPPQAPESPSHRLRAELNEIRERMRARFDPLALVGSGAVHQRLLGQVAVAASTTCPLLVQGEPGSGKRLVARMIHQKGPHARAPFLLVDVAAVPPRDLERSILPDGENASNDGPPGLAPGSSVAIGDILALPRDIQARLADRLQSTPGFARIIGLTRSDPEQARDDGRLQESLYYSLTTMVIRLPPLRGRLDELPVLAQEFLEQANVGRERRRWGFEPEAVEVLRAYDWPGNLAELSRVVQAAHQRASGDLVTEADLPPEIRGALGAAYSPPSPPSPVTPLDQTLEMVERRLIERALARSRRNKSKAAELLDISRPRLYRRIKELNIPDEGEQNSDGPSA